MEKLGWIFDTSELSTEEIIREFATMIVCLSKECTREIIANYLQCSTDILSRDIRQAGLQGTQGGYRQTVVKYSVVYQNKLMSLIDACRISGVSYNTILHKYHSSETNSIQDIFNEAL